MLRRGVTLLHTLVILFAGMIAAGGVAAFASFTYRTAADQELSIKAQFMLEGAVELAKWEVWNQDLALDTKNDYLIDGSTVMVDVTDTNSVTTSTWQADAAVSLEGRTYTLTRTIGLARFPKDRVNWVYNSNNQHYYALVTVRAGMDFSTALANSRDLRAPDGKAGYLATITSSAEWTWIKSKMLPAAGTKTVLTGGQQATGSTEPSGGWTWTNAEPFAYTDWQTGEPNNGGSGESLLALNLGGVQKFFDVPDQPGWTTFLVEAGAWVTWVRDPKTGRHYTYVPTPNLTWDQAKDLAAAIGGPYGEATYLMSVTTTHEHNFIKNTLLPAFSSPNGGWIGAYQPDGSAEPTNDWKWISGEPWGISGWCPGEPNNYIADGMEEDRAHLYSDGTWNDLWNDPRNLWAVPGFWVEAGKPLNWQYDSAAGRWYAVMPVEGGLTWTEANTWAQELVAPSGKQGYLATFTSAQELSFVSPLADDAKRADGSALWDDWSASWGSWGWSSAGPIVGLNQTNVTSEPAGGWMWANSEPLVFSDWALNQPNNYGGTEHRGHLVKQNGSWKFNDIDANLSIRGFAVEAGDPPVAWRQWPKASGGNDNWYAFISLPTGVSWDQANAYAKNLISPNGQAAYLLTLTSAAEHAWVQSNLIPSSPVLSSPNNGISWFGARQEPGSQESKMGWVYDNGESLISYWGQYSFQNFVSEPNESGTAFGTVSDWASKEDAGLLYFNSPTLSLGNYWNTPSYLTRNVIVESGTPSQLKLLESRWMCAWDGNATPHPDSARYGYPATDFQGALGPYEWPILSSSGKSRGLTDYDPVTDEQLIYTPGNRGGNTQVYIEQEGEASLPLDSATAENTGFFPVGAAGGQRQQHYKGTFYLQDASAVNSVTIQMNSVDNYGWVFINGQYAFAGGASLTNRSLLRVGDNRIDLIFNNYGGPGSNHLNISVPVRPYAKPISVVHPNQFALSIQNSMSLAGPTPYSTLKVEGNVYSGLGSTNLSWGAGSKVEGYLYTTSTASEAMLPHEYRVSGTPAISWPDYSTSDWHKAATTSYSSGSTITNPVFSSNGAMLSSAGTLYISGVFSGRGAIHADTVVVTGHLRPAAPDSLLSIVAREVRFGSTNSGDHYVDAVVFADSAVIVKPTVLTGSLAAKSLSMQSGQTSNLTIRQRDLVWRSKAIAKELKLPGYWRPSLLTGTYFRYGAMQDITAGEFAGGTVKWTLGGRLSSNYRPYSSPIGRTWHKPTIQMNQSSMPARTLNWWVAGTNVVQEKVQTDSMPISNPYPWWPDGGSSMGSRGVWWSGGFDAASQAEIDAMTFSMTTSDDMSAVYINGTLAIDHGGKHSQSWAGPSLTDRSMIRVGKNRIDIFMADLYGGGAMSMTSNISFYPTAPVPPTDIPAFAITDSPYNYGLNVSGAFAMSQNLTLYGDVMMGLNWTRSAGTQVFKGLAQTSSPLCPSGPTYEGVRVSGTTHLALPAFPATTQYSSRAHTILTSDSLSPQTNATGSPRLLYRDGNITISGTANWSGRITIVASGEIRVNSAINLANADSKVTMISYGNCLINPLGGTVRATILCNNQTTIQSTATIVGGLLTRNISQTSPLTVYHDGLHFFNPEEWKRSFFPDNLP